MDSMVNNGLSVCVCVRVCVCVWWSQTNCIERALTHTHPHTITHTHTNTHTQPQIYEQVACNVRLCPREAAIHSKQRGISRQNSEVWTKTYTLSKGGFPAKTPKCGCKDSQSNHAGIEHCLAGLTFQYTHTPTCQQMGATCLQPRVGSLVLVTTC